MVTLKPSNSSQATLANSQVACKNGLTYLIVSSFSIAASDAFMNFPTPLNDLKRSCRTFKTPKPLAASNATLATVNVFISCGASTQE